MIWSISINSQNYYSKIIPNVKYSKVCIKLLCKVYM